MTTMRSSKTRQRVEYLQMLIDDAYSEISWRQAACKHKKATRTKRENRGYDSPDRWVECSCPNCLKRWEE
jgi:hypothetical protein